MAKDCKRMCSSCPFRRDIKPGALGGSAPEVYIGQAFGPFRLPCHSGKGYYKNPDAKRALSMPQCAGAAIFRANCGLTEKLSAVKAGDGSGIHSLPADPHACFVSAAEFLAHHSRVPLHVAESMLRVVPVEILTRFQMMREGTRPPV